MNIYEQVYQWGEEILADVEAIEATSDSEANLIACAVVEHFRSL